MIGGLSVKKIIDDVRLIFKCCSLYYQDGLGQKEICEVLGISRPTVSRMLSIGRERGIVRIEIQNPDNIAYGQMERKKVWIAGGRYRSFQPPLGWAQTAELTAWQRCA